MIAALTLAPDDVDGRKAFDDCLARGNQPPTAFDRAQCEEVVRTGIVDGRYCAGTVEMFLDANGNKARRCIPRAVVDQKLEIMKRDPLPPRPSAPSSSRVPLIAASVALGIAAYFVLR